MSDSAPGGAFKAQKGSTDIVKTVHVTSMVHPKLYEATIILFVCKENKNDFIKQFLLLRVSRRVFTRVSRRMHGTLLNARRR